MHHPKHDTDNEKTITPDCRLWIALEWSAEQLKWRHSTDAPTMTSNLLKYGCAHWVHVECKVYQMHCAADAIVNGIPLLQIDECVKSADGSVYIESGHNSLTWNQPTVCVQSYCARNESAFALCLVARTCAGPVCEASAVEPSNASDVRALLTHRWPDAGEMRYRVSTMKIQIKL